MTRRLSADPADPDTMPAVIEPGDVAPDLELPDQQGSPVQLPSLPTAANGLSGELTFSLTG
jgi:hypothetical protein